MSFGHHRTVQSRFANCSLFLENRTLGQRSFSLPQHLRCLVSAQVAVVKVKNSDKVFAMKILNKQKVRWRNGVPCGAAVPP